MNCPFNLPVKKIDSKEPGSLWIVIDKIGIIISFPLKDFEADYIVTAINSHEKYKIACAKAYEGLCTNNLDACDEAIKLLDEITEAENPK